MGTRGLVALVAKVTCKSGLTGLWLEKKTVCTSCHFIPPGVLISGHRCHWLCACLEERAISGGEKGFPRETRPAFFPIPSNLRSCFIHIAYHFISSEFCKGSSRNASSRFHHVPNYLRRLFSALSQSLYHLPTLLSESVQFKFNLKILIFYQNFKEMNWHMYDLKSAHPFCFCFARKNKTIWKRRSEGKIPQNIQFSFFTSFFLFCAELSITPSFSRVLACLKPHRFALLSQQPFFL